MAQTVAKADLHQIIDELPDGVTWDDVLYTMQFRAKIDAGRDSARKGSTTTNDDIRRKHGLEPLS